MTSAPLPAIVGPAVSRQPFPVLSTAANPRSQEYADNHELNLEAVARLHALYAESRAGGGAKYVERHKARGKLLAARMDGSPFLVMLESGALVMPAPTE